MSTILFFAGATLLSCGSCSGKSTPRSVRTSYHWAALALLGLGCLLPK